MRPEDRQLIESVKLNDHAVLERVVNAGGELYSVILVDGVELYSAPTSEEDGMLDFYEETGT